jgi:predicted AAA+ superfamily ATPase
MIKRDISDKVLQYSKQYPVVIITGPRQSGKTTLCKMLFPDKPYLSLEDPDNRYYAQTDPRGFLSQFPKGAVLDEIQRIPDLFSYIQTIVDDRNLEGMFILTGSQQFELMEKVTQSLAGRAALVRLLPFSMKEIARLSDISSIEELLYAGSYPRIHDKKLNPTEALAFYINTYVERDVRNILNITDLSTFETFLRMCAGRTGQLLNLSSLGIECGVSHNTIKRWLTVLEASYIIKLLQPYYKNLNKRLVKTPKLFFLDTGLASYLLGIREPDHLISHPLRGALFETFVLDELLKKSYNTGSHDNFYFFRDHKGYEVDILLDKGQYCDIIEVKSGKTVVSDFFKNLNFFNKIYNNVKNQYIIYGGDQSRVQNNTRIIPWRDIHSLEF